jgi:hypothetical protein
LRAGLRREVVTRKVASYSGPSRITRSPYAPLPALAVILKTLALFPPRHPDV